MPDAALKNALLERDHIAAEINRIQQRSEELRARALVIDSWVKAWYEFAGTPADSAAEPEPSLEQDKNIQAANGSVDERHEEATERSRATGNPKKEIVAANARRIIEEAGQPVSRSDLYKELGLRGIHIEGKDPEQVLSTMLWRTYKDGFPVVRLPAGGYWLADRPHRESGYDPVDGMTYEIALSRYASLMKQIAEADRRYHTEDAPEISDADYDTLRREAKKIEARFPNLPASEAEAGGYSNDRQDEIDVSDSRDARFERITENTLEANLDDGPPPPPLDEDDYPFPQPSQIPRRA